ncbi:MAG TPA: YciI family protein [Streptosporangiaceae bacterium]
MAGAFAGPADGAALVFKGDDEAVAEQFAAEDPYVKHGLVRHWTVRRWTVVIGGGR